MFKSVLQSRSNAVRVVSRQFSSFTPVFKEAGQSEKFSTPQEYVEHKKKADLEEQAYRHNLLQNEFKYEPKYISANEVDPVTGRPVPINVELLKYKPLQLKQTHGHEVAKIKFRGYDEDNLIRAGEFATRSAYYLGIPTSKLTTKKTEKRLYTVIKSPFAQAKTKQNFHRTTFNKELVAYDANPEILDLWLSFINKYAIEDVSYKATMTTSESLDYNKEMDALASEDYTLPNAYNDITDPVAKKVEELLKSDTFKKLLEEEK
ncbi:Mitochondrial ribosomal protein S10 [Scheffersomyces stipitis CBS 6054]|uniref:Mitochondrial ribosomal protein S10 n=1 Tax=Scheffersomyces stipitis (strain ATCC 58785 / CBS 6054 / NBRC 10063 / NRRL Y-11545) TaxID=322104 RepID=A3GEX3_PICST|nr:mitochondrial 37S ribosomal protein RSM10 [Scheffersomyces stipitis CBS 6054]EAZ63660.2 Mitochondrial ribosomal protein S10 [Scheffersomyces stipitis CBS 6054]